MNDPRLAKLADLLVNYCVDVQPQEWVFIPGELIAAPLLREVYRAVLRAGGYPLALYEDEVLGEINAKEANEDQITWVSPLETLIYDEIDALISLRGTNNTRAMTNIDPAYFAKRQGSRRDLMATYLRRAAEGTLKWTITQYPTQASAQEAEMSLSEYEDFVYRATFTDQDDPVAEWNKISALQQRMVDWLKGKKHVTVKSANCDLSLSIEGRTFMNSDGKQNMPSGEIFTGPVEDSVNGWVHFTYPAIYQGRAVENVELRFEAGKVADGKATKNQDLLLNQLNIDPGASYLGEFAIGTNFGIQKFTGNVLFDEKIGGTFHMAVGAGYPETGSKNESAIHWDMICDMRAGGEIHVDGELFYKDGQFVV